MLALVIHRLVFWYHPILPLSLFKRTQHSCHGNGGKIGAEFRKSMRIVANARDAMVVHKQGRSNMQTNLVDLVFASGDQVLLSESHFKESTHGNLGPGGWFHQKIECYL
jgi:hypothetical protein